MTPNEIQQLLKEAYLQGIADFKRAVLEEVKVTAGTMCCIDVLDRAEEKIKKTIKSMCLCGKETTEEEKQKMIDEFEREYKNNTIIKTAGRALKALSKR